tara:strand:- start:527 stop:1477 length:951 start_codon:yes stop_codon:yes gene_type:complete
MNSVIQCLSHLLIFHPLNTEFFEECDNKNNCMIAEWFQFQRKMWSNDNNNSVNPLNILIQFQKDCKKYNMYFENFQQNDADEFLILFLDFLHKSIRCSMKIISNHKHDNPEIYKLIQNSYQTWMRFYGQDYSYIVEQFYSQLLSYTTCPLCEYYTTNHDPIQVISLEIPRKAENIIDCLKHYTRSITLDDDNLWTCDNCNQKVKSEKKTILWKTSDVLIISLKRFKNGHKINQFISFPEILELDDFSLNYGSNKNNKYSLQSLAIHKGSLNSGHYYAICKNPIDKQWHEYNDTTEKIIDKKEIHKELPYLFFYKRC